MKYSHNFGIALFFGLFISPVSADVYFYQPDKLAGDLTGYDGRQIQIQLKFSRPIKPEESAQLLVNNEMVLTLANKSTRDLTRFTTRLRLYKSDKITVKVSGTSDDQTSTFSPTVATDYSPPSKDEYSPQPMVRRAASQQMKDVYGAEVGDCMYLLLGISNSGDTKPKEFELKTDVGSIRISSSDRISTNPFFVIGSDSVYTKCELNIKK